MVADHADREARRRAGGRAARAWRARRSGPRRRPRRCRRPSSAIVQLVALGRQRCVDRAPTLTRFARELDRSSRRSEAAATSSRELPAVDEVHAAHPAARTRRMARPGRPTLTSMLSRPAAPQLVQRADQRGTAGSPADEIGAGRDRAEESRAVHLEGADRARYRDRRVRARDCPCRAPAGLRSASSASASPSTRRSRRAPTGGRERVAARIRRGSP